jgi:hypothetical protein
VPSEDWRQLEWHTSFFKGLARHVHDAQRRITRTVTELCSDPPIIVTARTERDNRIQGMCLRRLLMRRTHGAHSEIVFCVPSVLIQKETIGYAELFAGEHDEQRDEAQAQAAAPGTEAQPR